MTNEIMVAVEIILGHYRHAYANIDGTMAWPNSREGDILRGSFQILKDLGPYVKELQDKYDAREKEAHELSEKIIVLRRTNAEKDEALEAARLLCANLRNGGHGHMTLVENFENKDN